MTYECARQTDRLTDVVLNYLMQLKAENSVRKYKTPRVHEMHNENVNIMYTHI